MTRLNPAGFSKCCCLDYRGRSQTGSIIPTAVWFTLNTVTLANASPLSLEATAPGPRARLQRLVPVPEWRFRVSE